MKLNNILNKIRSLDKINQEIQDNVWDSNIKYIRSLNKTLVDLNPNYYLERGKWTDFILLAKEFNKNNFKKLNPFTIEDLLDSKLRLALLLFLRDIANKLDSNTRFKLQLNNEV